MNGDCRSDDVSALALALPRVMLLSDFSGSAWAAMFGCAAASLSAEPASGSRLPPGDRPNRASSESPLPPLPLPPRPAMSGSTRPPTSRPKADADGGWPSDRAKSPLPGPAVFGSGANGSQSSGMPPGDAAAAGAAAGAGARAGGGTAKAASGSAKPAAAGAGDRPAWPPRGVPAASPAKSANGSATAAPPGAAPASTRIAKPPMLISSPMLRSASWPLPSGRPLIEIGLLPRSTTA